MVQWCVQCVRANRGKFLSPSASPTSGLRKLFFLYFTGAPIAKQILKFFQKILKTVDVITL